MLIYTLMDQQREVVLFRRPDVYSISQDERAMMKKRQKYSDAYSALLLREQREERHRQDVENWNAALELEVDSDDDKDLQNTEEDDLMFEYGVHHHHHRSCVDERVQRRGMTTPPNISLLPSQRKHSGMVMKVLGRKVNPDPV